MLNYRFPTQGPITVGEKRTKTVFQIRLEYSPFAEQMSGDLSLTYISHLFTSLSPCFGKYVISNSGAMSKASPNFHINASDLRWIPQHKSRNEVTFAPLSNLEAMAIDGLDGKVSQWREFYEREPNFGFSERTGFPAVFSPPPVKRVVAIYGINLDTEVASCYRRKNFRFVPGKMNTKFGLDTYLSLSLSLFLSPLSLLLPSLASSQDN